MFGVFLVSLQANYSLLNTRYMKKLCLALLLIVPFILSAQTAEKRNQLGLNFTSLNDFGVRYKTGTDKGLFRFTALSIYGNDSSTDKNSVNYKDQNFGAGLNLGYEFHTPLNEKLDFYYGPELISRFSYTDKEEDYVSYTRTMLRTGIGFVLGVELELGKNLLFAAEIIPSISYQYQDIEREYEDGTHDDYSTTSYIFDASNSGANLTLAYTF